MTSDEKENFFDPNPGMVRVNSRKGVKISEYDNAVTALYKLSDSLLIPIEYIYLEGNNFKNYTYTTVNKIIADRIGEDIELKDFYQEISDKLPKLKWWELGLLYYEVVTVKLKQLCENTGNEEMIERCTNLGTKKNLIKSINQMFAAVREAGKSEDEELIDITNLDAFASEYKKWSKTRKMKMKEQSEISEKISSVQEELDSIRGVRYYKPNIDTVTYKLKPMISGKEGPYRPSPEEGIEIFKNAIVSEDVPYIQYNPEDGRNLFWIFNNNNKAVSPVSYLDHISQSTRINTIYILLWLSDAKQKNNLVKCIYYVDTGEFTLKAPNKGGGLKKLRKNIEAAFPMLILGKEKQIRVQGYFEVDDVLYA
jgi:nucleoid DNA-binding protein